MVGNGEVDRSDVIRRPERVVNSKEVGRSARCSCEWERGDRL